LTGTSRVSGHAHRTVFESSSLRERVVCADADTRTRRGLYLKLLDVANAVHDSRLHAGQINVDCCGTSAEERYRERYHESGDAAHCGLVRLFVALENS
jgi:hypothetical protein